MTAPEGLDAALTRLGTAERLLVALDFDGVLAPIVAVPSAARPLPEAVAALDVLARCPGTTVAMLSGRGRADLAAVSGFGPPIRLVGSHGSEFDDGVGPLDSDQLARLTHLATALRALADGAPGVVLEEKPTGIAVHVRNAAPEVGERVLAAVRAGPAAWEGVEATPGKAVLDLSVARMDKGAALEVLREQAGADVVLFAGDDVTDETAFARLRGHDVGVKVGPGDTLAGHRVAGPAEMADLLARLAAARTS